MDLGVVDDKAVARQAARRDGRDHLGQGRVARWRRRSDHALDRGGPARRQLVGDGLVAPAVPASQPPDHVLTPFFYASTLTAGLVVGAVNFGLARLVVGRRLRLLADRMGTVEERLGQAVYTQDWSSCDPEACALPVDSADEVGAAAGSFNRLIHTLARTHAVERAMRDFSGVLSSEFELEGLGDAALDASCATPARMQG